MQLNTNAKQRLQLHTVSELKFYIPLDTKYVHSEMFFLAKPLA